MMHKIGERISSFRKDRNMSQEELARVLNVSRQTVSKWETGDTLPDVFNAVAIAKLFHITLDGLILGTRTSLSGVSYIEELRDKRQKTNLKAMIVGAIGSTIFVVSLILVRSLGVSELTSGVTAAIVLPILMFCWGFAIWNFIKISRIGEEIKYLEKMELMSFQSNLISKT